MSKDFFCNKTMTRNLARAAELRSKKISVPSEPQEKSPRDIFLEDHLAPGFANEMKAQTGTLLNKYFPLHTVGECAADEEVFKYLHCIGTYMLCNQGKIIYIGVSVRVGNRILNHLRSNIFGEYIETIKLVRSYSYDFCANLEAHLLMKLRPKFNRSIPPYLPCAHRFTEQENKEMKTLFDKISNELRDAVAR